MILRSQYYLLIAGDIRNIARAAGQVVAAAASATMRITSRVLGERRGRTLPLPITKLSQAQDRLSKINLLRLMRLLTEVEYNYNKEGGEDQLTITTKEPYIQGEPRQKKVWTRGQLVQEPINYGRRYGGPPGTSKRVWRTEQ